MNLFLRLLRIYFQAAFSSDRIGMLDPAILKFRVWLTDQDMFAHMTNSRYMSFADLGTINYIIRSGFWPVLRKRGWFPVICGQSTIITRMLRTPQKFDLETRVVGWNDTYVGLLHEFKRNGRTHAAVRIVARFASSEGVVSTDEVMSAMPFDHDSPSLPEDYLRMVNEVETRRLAFKGQTKLK